MGCLLASEDTVLACATTAVRFTSELLIPLKKPRVPLSKNPKNYGEGFIVTDERPSEYRRLIVDIETNGLLDELDTLHCMVVGDEEGNILFSPGGPGADFGPALEALATADEVIGHNVVRFDIPALKKLFPAWSPRGKVRDTIIYSKIIWPNLADLDYANYRRGTVPGGIAGQHRLEAWGLRLGVLKDEYAGDMDEPDEKKRKAEKWLRWNRFMQSYMEQDYRTTLALWQKVKAKLPAIPASVVELEHDVAQIIFRQERFGVRFNVTKATTLAAELTAKRNELLIQLRERFPEWRDEEVFIPKVNNKTRGYVKGEPFTKVKITQFQPSNRFHIERAFREHLGWEPTEFNDDGSAVTDEETLSMLPYPEAKLVVEYLVLSKLLGYIQNGNKAWLRFVDGNGIIRGRVDSVGAHTFRMTHSDPNLGQVPAAGSAYGLECRDLFEPVFGVQVGIDADALEGRIMGHYLAIFDRGEFIETLLKGKKEDGTDLHSRNCRFAGRDPKETYTRGTATMPWREGMKEFFYALVYGAFPPTLGRILGLHGEAAKKEGQRVNDAILEGLPALRDLGVDVRTKWARQRTIKAVDGRPLYPRSRNAALNTLFQSAGAIAMKVALVILDRLLQARGFVPGVDYEFMLNVHDEWQLCCRPEIAEEVKALGCEAITKAGEALNLRCPLVGSAKGPATSWAGTH